MTNKTVFIARWLDVPGYCFCHQLHIG